MNFQIVLKYDYITTLLNYITELLKLTIKLFIQKYKLIQSLTTLVIKTLKSWVIENSVIKTLM